MSMTQEILEMLIGKYIDGEITSSERQMLEAAMESDPKAKELLEQLQDLHQQSREAISSEVLDKGRAADEIFEQAWQHRTKNPLLRIIRIGGLLRFAAGLAAGLVIGMTLHFALPNRPMPKNDVVQEKIIAQDTTSQAGVKNESMRTFQSSRTPRVSRNVDWYSYTDKNGNQWLVEGLSENIATPVAYRPGL
jgi:anti-sigma factor RsiW